MPIELAIQKGVTRLFEIKVYDPLTDNENAADTAPTLTLTDAGSNVRGPYTSTLKPGSAGTYRVLVLMDPTWPEGEYIGEWSYTLAALIYKPRFTFHVHQVEVTS